MCYSRKNIYKRKQDRLLTRKILASSTKDSPASTSQDTIIFTKRKHIVKFVDKHEDSDESHESGESKKSEDTPSAEVDGDKEDPDFVYSGR